MGRARKTVDLLAICLMLPALSAGALENPPSGAVAPASPALLPSSRITLDAATRHAATLPRLHSLLVSWRGELLLERYYNGIRAGRTANIKSVSKSVLSALIGIAIERGYLKSIQEPMASFFPDLLEEERMAPKRAINIEHLLTMQSGLASTSNRNYGAWVQSSHWVRYVLRRDLVRPPGTAMEYSTGNTHLLSAILTRATGRSTWQFAEEALAQPLGFRLARWPQDPQGIYFGGNDMEMTPRQMLAFGEMYLNGGRAAGRQIVPQRWVEASLLPHAQSRRDSSRYYGYGWWIRELGGYRTAYAWGYGGQFIFLVPDLQLVVVTTSSATPGDERGRHTRQIYQLVEQLVIPSIAPAAAQDARPPAEEAARTPR